MILNYCISCFSKHWFACVRWTSFSNLNRILLVKLILLVYQHLFFVDNSNSAVTVWAAISSLKGSWIEETVYFLKFLIKTHSWISKSFSCTIAIDIGKHFIFFGCLLILICWNLKLINFLDLSFKRLRCSIFLKTLCHCI